MVVVLIVSPIPLPFTDDPFFNHPGARVECASLQSSLVSPNHFLKLFVHLSSWKGSGSCRGGGATIAGSNNVTHTVNYQCQLMQLWRLSYNSTDPIYNETATSVPNALFLQGPAGAIGSVQMEGTKYLVDIRCCLFVAAMLMFCVVDAPHQAICRVSGSAVYGCAE